LEELMSLADLLDLQAVDLDIDRLLHRRETVPEIERHRVASAALTTLERRAAFAEEERAAVVKTIDRAEDELVLLTEKAEQEERRLYAGSLTAREATHMRDEVQMLRRQISEKEDALLELMEAREVCDGGLAALSDERKAKIIDVEALQASIDEQWHELDIELGRKESRKATIVPSIDGELLELYEKLRQTKTAGVAVGILRDGVCGACHITLSPGEQHEALAEEPPRCVHCRCILVP